MVFDGFSYLVFRISQLFYQYILPYASFSAIPYMIILNYSPTSLWIYTYFIGIFLAGLRGQTCFTFMFLTMFSLMFLC